MNFGTAVINVLLIILMFVLLIVPFLVELILFKFEKKKNISHRRWNSYLCSLLFMLVATLFLVSTDGLFNWTANRWLSLWETEELIKRAQQMYIDRVKYVYTVNLAIEIIFVLFCVYFRYGYKKYDILKPAGSNGKFTLLQKLERWVLKRLNNEMWFLIGRIVFYAGVAFSVLYSVFFVLSIVPALFPFDFSYHKLHMVFESCYLYPVITLLVLWETYYLLEGAKRINVECPGFMGNTKASKTETDIDLYEIDEDVKKSFGAFYKCDISATENILKEVSAEHSAFAGFIGKAAFNDPRNPLEYNDSYLNCMDKLAETEKSVVINGNFFSAFSGYFLRYLSVIVTWKDTLANLHFADIE